MPTFLTPLGVTRQFEVGRLLGQLVSGGSALLIAVFFGLVASTGDPIYIGLAVGLLFGALLMARPVWTVWVILFFGLLVVGVLPIWADEHISKAVWGISLLGFTLLLRAWSEAIAIPGTVRHTPAFVWLALAFVLYTLVNTLVQLPSAYAALSGFKRYFQVIGLLFALAWLPIGESDVRRWAGFVLIVALLQLPWALYELLALVPIREGLLSAYPGLVPIDVVAGTFGAHMYEGGANGEMAAFLIIVLALLLARLRTGQISIRRLLLLLPLLIAPLFLGETKVVVLLLPLMFLALYRGELIAHPHLALVGLMLGAALTLGTLVTYVKLSGDTGLHDAVQGALRYNVYEEGYGDYELNRTRVLNLLGGTARPARPCRYLVRPRFRHSPRCHPRRSSSYLRRLRHQPDCRLILVMGAGRSRHNLIPKRPGLRLAGSQPSTAFCYFSGQVKGRFSCYPGQSPALRTVSFLPPSSTGSATFPNRVLWLVRLPSLALQAAQ